MDIVLSSSESAGSFGPSVTRSNPIKRLRPPAPHHPIKEEQLDSQPQNETLFSEITSNLKHFWFPVRTPQALNRHPSLHQWSRTCLKWMLITYCFLSFVFFSLDLYTQAPITGTGETRSTHYPIYIAVSDRDAGVYASLSAFDDTSTAQRLSRLFSLQISDHLEFDPFIIRAEKRKDDVVSACLWVPELQDVEVLRSWVSRWQGPVSLLITTTASPRSGSLAALFHRLHTLSTEPLPGLSVHLLHTGMHDQASSNSYLNLARFFASTSIVMLVPGNLSEPPPISHGIVASQVLQSTAPFLAIITRNSINGSDFSTLPQLPPVIIPRNHPIWCTERPLLRQTRASEWKTCIWQLWLDSFGDYMVINTVEEMTGSASYEVVNFAHCPLHLAESFDDQTANDRLSNRFKAETCDLMAKSLAIVGLKKQKDGRKKLLWLKEACGQVTITNIEVS